MNKNKNLATLIMTFLFMIVLFYVGFNLFSNNSEPMSYNDLINNIESGDIKSINLESNNGVYNVTGTMGDDETKFETNVPQTDFVVNEINTVTSDNDVEVTYSQRPDNSFIYSTIFTLLMIVGIIFFLRFVTRGMGANGKDNPGSVNVTEATNNKIKFSDVIGYKEEKEELTEVIDYLNDPKKYTNIGARIPKGILLEGPPGTGKTLMAKAIAGEASIPFLPISGSDFIEMYAGVGASRVRSLFEEAKKHNKAIVFIDEIDAIGSRDKSGDGRNSEHEQTINQLLTELDGFGTDPNKTIIIIAATNRADKLDSALTRPGRFDRKILIGNPNLEDREAILKYHASKRKYDDNIDFNAIAKIAIGMSGADLESVINEAAILAVRDKRKEFDQQDLSEAVDRVQMGPAKITNKYNDRDKEFVSYHESGHAVIGLELEGAKKVEKITIIPRRYANGYVSYTPDESRGHFKSKEDLFDEIVGLLGGRTSEELFLDDITTGAENDLERATKIARAMVTEYSMTDVAFTQLEQNSYKEMMSHKAFSESTNVKIDSKINEILDEAYEKAKDILTKRADDVHKLAELLKEKETLSKAQIDELLGNTSTIV